MFDHKSPAREASRVLLGLSQKGRWVIDYAIEFRTLAADSGWNTAAINDAFVNGLSEEVKDQLAPHKLPLHFEDLVDIAVRIDNRLQEREKERRCAGRRTTDFQARQDQAGSRGKTAASEGRSLLLLRTAGSSRGFLSSKRGGSPGMRRAMVSRLTSQDFPPRTPTRVTLTVNGNTTPHQALIDSGANESLIDGGLAHELGEVPESKDPAPGHSDYPDRVAKVPSCYHDIKEVFSKSRATSLPPHRESDYAIDLIPGAPIPKACLYSISGHERKAMDQYIVESLKSGIVRPSSSPAGAGFFFVGKKDGSLRPCIDYSASNDITVKNRYPLPLISSAFELLQQAKVFTKLDLRNAYHLVRIREGDEWKTGFNTPSGHNEYLVLTRLMEPQLYVNAEKCEFHASSVSFLGYIISANHIRMDPEKLKSDDWSPDFGPAQFVPSWGATVTGARKFLIAYNVNLISTKEQAHRIALNIREQGRGKGQPGLLQKVQAMGWYLDEANLAQVSTNILDFELTPLHKVYEEICRDAEDLKLPMVGSQIVGLIPLKALLDSADFYIRRDGLFIVEEEHKVRLVISKLGLDSLGPFNLKERIIE
ncbi:hypothetical protein L3Q82_010033 [Scortum barcoo]|uniref:Uncharacterized protein n=1 Tax=Scortum barcoo TaxID=214431 RepID=A0ACB8WEN2_9TELE|nr:hypothetical protein L3Q82_010033 [Scortum barcoo]